MTDPDDGGRGFAHLGGLGLEILSPMLATVFMVANRNSSETTEPRCHASSRLSRPSSFHVL